MIHPILNTSHPDHEHFNYCRSISNLSYESKSKEQVVTDPLITHLDYNSLTELSYSAYWKPDLTETAVLYAMFNF